jgi:hypothetical protein
VRGGLRIKDKRQKTKDPGAYGKAEEGRVKSKD